MNEVRVDVGFHFQAGLPAVLQEIFRRAAKVSAIERTAGLTRDAPVHAPGRRLVCVRFAGCCVPVDCGRRGARLCGLIGCRLLKVADETRMKQKPFSCENVVKQIAGINGRHGAVIRKSRTQ